MWHALCHMVPRCTVPGVLSLRGPRGRPPDCLSGILFDTPPGPSWPRLVKGDWMVTTGAQIGPVGFRSEKKARRIPLCRYATGVTGARGSEGRVLRTGRPVFFLSWTCVCSPAAAEARGGRGVFGFLDPGAHLAFPPALGPCPRSELSGCQAVPLPQAAPVLGFHSASRHRP